MSGADTHRDEVRRRVKHSLQNGCFHFHDVLARTGGADPRLVHSILDELKPERTTGGSTDASSDLSAKRSAILELLPAPDPALAQWWYTAEAQERIVRRILEHRQDQDSFKVLCVGAPSVAPLLSESGCSVQVLDTDPDIINALGDFCPDAQLLRCDLLNEEPNLEPCNLALVDPPWYTPEMEVFIWRAIGYLELGGFLYVGLPPLLLRPNIDAERRQLLKELQSHGMDILFLDRNAVSYAVPRFEEAAFENIDDFCGQPWRRGDLLVCAKREKRLLPSSEKEHIGAITVERFSRNPKEFRVFLGNESNRADPKTTIVEMPDFSQNVSRRAHDGAFPNVWTSEKRGAHVENLDEARIVISSWESGLDRKATSSELQNQRSLAPGTADMIVEKYDDVLKLWEKYLAGIDHRRPEEIEKAKVSAMSQWAATGASEREVKNEHDEFRLTFQRDRDRVLWSGSFRQLAGKTQLFPITEGDQLRQRLAHSVEVMQLASTIADSFGLDRDLTEAGALAHDIGHTPFGHAGEYAMDKLLMSVSHAEVAGFNHYEHGVDVVRYLEGPYQQLERHGHPGLNLTPEVCECIFKHTYCQGGTRISHDEIRKRSKHQKFLMDGYCHLEGQAIRIADKVSYLISDIEDGIRLDAIDEAALTSCRLFRRPPIDLSQPHGEHLRTRFLIQRRHVIRVLMSDIITETGRRLSKISNPAAVRSQARYLVDHSDALKADVDEVWSILQVSRLHRDARVVRSNMKAAKIVSELLILVALFPELIPQRFRQEHERLWSKPYIRFYAKELGNNVELPGQLLGFLPLDRFIGLPDNASMSRIRVEHLIMAKDFVASMTDSQAKSLYVEFLEK